MLNIDTFGLLPPLLALAVAVLTTYFIRKIAPTNTSDSRKSRFVSIDGLRGYLAFFVFIHHAVVWYFYLHSGAWKIPPSKLYTHLGQTSLSFFFMITAFLFFLKLLDSDHKPIDWARLFIARVLRLAPLYLFVVAIVFFIVAYLTGGQLKIPLWKLVAEIVNWILFSIYGMTNINGLPNTALIVSEVTWSLSYEWFFYLLLPFMAMIVGRRSVPIFYLFISLLTIALIIVLNPDSKYVLSFFAGIFAAYALRFERVVRLANTRVASWVAIAVLLIEVNVYSSAYSFIPQLLIFIAFLILVCGNDLFGALSNQVSRALGEVSYSIYLLHGILLFIVMNFVLGLEQARILDWQHYWLVIICITPILILISFLTFRFIESPAMKSTSFVMDKLIAKR